MANHEHDFSTIDFTEENIETYFDQLNILPPVDLSDIIASKSLDEQLIIFDRLPLEKKVLVFEYLPFRIQQELLKVLPSQLVASLLNALSPDDRTTLLSELPADLMPLLIKYLSPKERLMTIKLLGYPPDSVGRLMTPDYIAIKLNWTVQEVLSYIRKVGRDSETINVIYAIDDQGILLDDFRIRQFLLADPDEIVINLSDHRFIALNVNDDQEKAINIFRKYARSALPVIDSKGILLGIVTSDDIMEAAIKENTEDMQKIGGVEVLKQPYLEVPIFSLINKRMKWLVFLFLGELLTASAMGYFEAEIDKAVVLALFIPLIISSGGNAGSQASTLVIRSMALGEVTLKDWWRVMHREIISGIALGVVLGIIGFFRVTLWSAFSNIYGAHWFLVALTLFFSLIGVVTWGSLMGSMLPIFLQRCGFDPAVSSAPFVATLVDVTGLIIYFGIAILILSGTLL